MPFATESLTSTSPLDLVGPVPNAAAPGDRGGHPFESLLQPPPAAVPAAPEPAPAPPKPAESSQQQSPASEASRPSSDDQDAQVADGTRQDDQQGKPAAAPAAEAKRPDRDDKETKDDEAQDAQASEAAAATALVAQILVHVPVQALPVKLEEKVEKVGAGKGKAKATDAGNQVAKPAEGLAAVAPDAATAAPQIAPVTPVEQVPQVGDQETQDSADARMAGVQKGPETPQVAPQLATPKATAAAALDPKQFAAKPASAETPSNGPKSAKSADTAGSPAKAETSGAVESATDVTDLRDEKTADKTDEPAADSSAKDTGPKPPSPDLTAQIAAATTPPPDGAASANTPPPAAITPRLPMEVLGGTNSQRPADSVAPRVDEARLLHRVARAFVAAQHRDGEIRLRLSPPELGAVRLEVRVQDGAMVAHVQTETSAARTAIIDSLPALRERLADQGVRIDRFDVDLMQHQPGSPDQPGQRQQQDPQSAPRPWDGQARRPAPAEGVVARRAAYSPDSRGLNVIV